MAASYAPEQLPLIAGLDEILKTTDQQRAAASVWSGRVTLICSILPRNAAEWSVNKIAS